MDPTTITWLAISAGSMILGHLGILKAFLPAPTATPPAPPTTIGHGELLNYLRQELANFVATQPGLPAPTPPAPVVPAAPAPPAAPPMDLGQALTQFLSFLQSVWPPPPAVPNAAPMMPMPATPAAPTPKV